MDLLRTLLNDEDSTVTKLIQKEKSQPCPQLPLVIDMSVCSTQTHEERQQASSRPCSRGNTSELCIEAVIAVWYVVGGAVGLRFYRIGRG